MNKKNNRFRLSTHDIRALLVEVMLCVLKEPSSQATTLDLSMITEFFLANLVHIGKQDDKKAEIPATNIFGESFCGRVIS